MVKGGFRVNVCSVAEKTQLSGSENQKNKKKEEEEEKEGKKRKRKEYKRGIMLGTVSVGDTKKGTEKGGKK